jgi:hypothetical protein
MAKKKKKVTRKKAVKKKSVKKKVVSSEPSVVKNLFIAFFMLVFKVFGLAFIVQGFILQFGSGILYEGLIHYLIGSLFLLVSYYLNKRL